MFYLSCIVCVAAVALVQYLQFGQTTHRYANSGVAAFFAIEDIVQGQHKVFLSICCLLPLTCVFAVSLYYTDIIAQGIVAFTATAFGLSPEEINRYFPQDAIPKSLRPVVITIFLIMALGSQFSALQRRIETGIMQLFRVRQEVNEIMYHISVGILEKIHYRRAVFLLVNVTCHPIQLPRELSGVSNEEKLAFQLLELAKTKIPTKGPHEGITEIIDKYFSGYLSQEYLRNLYDKARVPIRHAYVYRMSVVYAVVGGVYTVAVPHIPDYLTFSRLDWTQIEWPTYEHVGIQLREIAVRAVGAFFPVVAALLYLERRWSESQRARTSLLWAVVTVTFGWCVIVNSIHIGIYLLQLGFDPLAFFQPTDPAAVEGLLPEVVYIVAYSVVPAIIVLMLAPLPRAGTFSVWKGVLGGVLIGVGFMLAQMLFEWQGNWSNKYYWHQGLLGVIMGWAALIPGVAGSSEEAGRSQS